MGGDVAEEVTWMVTQRRRLSLGVDATEEDVTSVVMHQKKRSRGW